MSITYIHKTANLVAVNKPAGIHSHPIAKSKNNSIAELVFEEIPEIRIAGPSSLEGGLLHRLDQGTSGCLLFARNKKTYSNFKILFEEQKIRKFYLCWCYPSTENYEDLREGAVRLYLTHDPKSKKKMKAFTKPPKQKHWVADTNVFLVAQVENLNLFLVEIKSGVTHQIRVTMSSLGLPILSDPIYCKPSMRLKNLKPKSIQPDEKNRLEKIWKQFLEKNKEAVFFPLQTSAPKNAFFLHALAVQSDATSELKKTIFAKPPTYFISTKNEFDLGLH
ncbi:MAG: pseudouridine synthase family protein [Bacteriovoracia bacterium]